MTELILKEECFQIVGACFEVYKNKGCGFLESVYQECLQIEFDHLQIPHESQKELVLTYRGNDLKQKFIPDFICFGKIILEIKAVDRLHDIHRSQVLNYLNATGFRLGILMNFGSHPKAEWERLVI